MTSTPTLAEELESTLSTLDDHQVQRLFGLLLHEYAERILAATETPLAPWAPDAGITATEALVAAGQIMRAANISSFELATILNI
jgi:hypothetical protein